MALCKFGKDSKDSRNNGIGAHRWLVAVLLAISVVYLLFSVMLNFIQSDHGRMIIDDPVEVRIASVEEVQLIEQNLEQTINLEPAIKPLDLEPVVNDVFIQDPDLDVELDMPELNAVDVNLVEKSQRLWNQPGQVDASSIGNGETGSDTDYIGRRAQTKRVVTPVSTRRPNIPKVAYENQVDGWVMLAFTVNPDGRVSDVQVMDAYPRGIFEANAIEAISSWRYSPFKKQRKRDPDPKPIRLAQKIEFKWSMYNYNMDF